MCLPVDDVPALCKSIIDAWIDPPLDVYRQRGGVVQPLRLVGQRHPWSLDRLLHVCVVDRHVLGSARRPCAQNTL